MSYPSDMTDDQWQRLEPVLNPRDKRGPKFTDLRTVVNAMLYIAHTGCQWRFLPSEYGKWTKVGSQFYRWRNKGVWAKALAALHEQVREAAGRDPTPSMVIIDPSLVRGASNGGKTFHDKGGPRGGTNGAKSVVAVDITTLPIAAEVVPASVHDGVAALGLMERADLGTRLDLVIVDRGVTPKQAACLAAKHSATVDRIGWDEPSPVFRPIRLAWRVEVAHGRIGRSRRIAKSYDNTVTSATAWLQIACVALHMVALK
jgi:putative transposase